MYALFQAANLLLGVIRLERSVGCTMHMCIIFKADHRVQTRPAERGANATLADRLGACAFLTGTATVPHSIIILDPV
jgi:hypothetical protein